jgi:hypothetical protein
VNIAYQVIGDGPIDLVFVMGWVLPSFANFLQRLAKFSRLIVFDKRGTGLSDRVDEKNLPTLEQRMDDVRAVMDACGRSRVCRETGGSTSPPPERPSRVPLVPARVELGQDVDQFEKFFRRHGLLAETPCPDGGVRSLKPPRQFRHAEPLLGDLNRSRNQRVSG